MKLLAGCFSLFACLAVVHANTEKTIFITPPAAPLPAYLQDLKLDTISPQNSNLRRVLPVSFPEEAEGDKKRSGETSWYLLSNLNPSQRYEVRICWAATQPTEFWFDTLEPSNAFDDPLIQRQLLEHERGVLELDTKADHYVSYLLLRVIAAADFYTTNKTLMRRPPPVYVNIILDPFLGNIFPQSLVPTAAYILVLAAISWPISRLAWKLLSSSDPGNKPHTD